MLKDEMLNISNDSIDAIVIGGNGGIGNALVKKLSQLNEIGSVYCCSRKKPNGLPSEANWIPFDITSENSIIEASQNIKRQCQNVRLIIIASGILYDKYANMPEKSLKDINADYFFEVFKINTLGPILTAKHFTSIFEKQNKTIMCILSARVGSIEDNNLGGWYSYRSSKSAVNMMAKSLSIEMKRKNGDSITALIHPGTVDTALSKPFQSSVAKNKLFTTDKAAESILSVIGGWNNESNGGFFAWNGQKIPF